MPAVLSAAFLVIVAAVVAMQRKPLAEMQALVIGGRLGPGCVIAQAIVLVVIAIAILIAWRTGLV